MPVLLRVDRAGKIDAAGAEGREVRQGSAAEPAGRQQGQQRRNAITCLAYVEGNVYVAGLSNEEFASKLRAIPFPFTEADKGTSVEIFHGSHGKVETNSPIRTFIPYEIKAR